MIWLLWTLGYIAYLLIFSNKHKDMIEHVESSMKYTHPLALDYTAHIVFFLLYWIYPIAAFYLTRSAYYDWRDKE